MLFIDPLFLFCILPLSICSFYGTGKLFGATAALGAICIASAVFYAPYGIFPFELLATSLTINWAIGSALSSRAKCSESTGWWLLALGLFLNFSALILFKYLGPAASALNLSATPLLSAVIPAGISFYTFHQSVFLVDAYNRRREVIDLLRGGGQPAYSANSFVKYAAFVALFPQLVIGPITYMSEFAPQVLARRFAQFRVVDLEVGITLVIVGLFKKLCIADPIAALINPIYAEIASGHPIARVQAGIAMVGYFFQLYFDFSGYADIAIGIGRLFGLRLPVNFDSPLRATGIIDFYRRWHITLTRVIALFVFTPLSLSGTRFALGRGYGGLRLRLFTTWLPALFNFQLIALWHAAKWTFVVFGLAHGIWYIVESEVRAGSWFKSFRRRTSDDFRLVAGMAITVIPLVTTFTLFRCGSLGEFGRLVGTLLGLEVPADATLYVNRRDWMRLAVAAVIVYLCPNIFDMMRRYRPGIITYANQSNVLRFARVLWRPNAIWGAIVAGLLAVAILSINKPSPFLYAGF